MPIVVEGIGTKIHAKYMKKIASVGQIPNIKPVNLVFLAGIFMTVMAWNMSRKIYTLGEYGIVEIRNLIMICILKRPM